MYPLHSADDASAAEAGAGDATQKAMVSRDESPRTTPTPRRLSKMLSTTEKFVVAHGASEGSRAAFCD